MPAIVTGKKVRYALTSATLVQSRPIQSTTIGASATIGTVWLAITYGTSARSSRLAVDEDDRQDGAEDGAEHEACECAPPA